MVAAILSALSLRRAVLAGAALLAPRAIAGFGAQPLPAVTLVVPAFDEARGVGGLLAALERLDYPPDRLFTVLVDDASADGTGERFERWAAGRARTQALSLPRREGKSPAVNRGMEAAPAAEVIAVCDADVRPRPDCLRAVVEAFGDERVGLASAYRSPQNAASSAAARYAALEAWVTQLVTSAAKDRLDLNPPVCGGCSAYRRSALEQAGGFGPGPGEDVRITVALTLAGWSTRFVRAAVVDETVVHRSDDYWHQHVRWGRNLFATASRRPPSGRTRAPLDRRIETWMLSAGYADRLIVLAALSLVATGRLPLRFPAAYLTVRGAEVGVALLRAGVGRQAPRFVASVAAFFPLDVVASVASALGHLRRAPRTWRHPQRPAEHGGLRSSR